ncbi:hypothetical protein CONPUDRAFT_75006 [Coniophora puteana RWD-64-598 SS2]|uniref:Uncharacterized protein n=1 Tax=Coniophora puteana (strain RWD-64-598) TaxID=741705 RepID=A0A5M3MGC6_CONPW|nr:uncharacterized protein CONPUDRAFT_75006 [Coniophora puteana RWD-64-598 SS2]EIW78272.1 hypothetical protein CONPUDRAFT_75006 [Coniophora puteana RWD-64-598 SS2]
MSIEAFMEYEMLVEVERSRSSPRSPRLWRLFKFAAWKPNVSSGTFTSPPNEVLKSASARTVVQDTVNFEFFSVLGEYGRWSGMNATREKDVVVGYVTFKMGDVKGGINIFSATISSREIDEVVHIIVSGQGLRGLGGYQGIVCVSDVILNTTNST